ncbi:alpha/beta fold hydrolase [Novosphingobium bradum]|uniref:Alpha/beta fold hydrolase n=1 Tax=Novosphingobium bradum TaxID=1737444 RepID=A0ABV7IRD6_9SPHN
MPEAVPSPVADPAEQVAALERRAERFAIPCGEGTMVWRRWGPEGGAAAPVLLLVHGAQGSWTHWFRNIPDLARTHTVWAPDIPGCGESAAVADDGPVREAIAEAFARGLRELVGEGLPIDAVGFSFGAITLASLDVLHPGLLRRLVIVDAGGLHTPHGHFELKRIKGLEGAERVAVLRENLLAFMLHDPATADALTVHIHATNIAQAGRRLNVGPLVLPDKLLTALPHVSAQVDAIWGDSDAPHPDPAVQEAALRTAVPDLEFRVLPDAGHWAMYERPEAFDRALRELLALPLRKGCGARRG